MKEKLTDEIKDIFAQSKTWVKLEIEYAKLTLAEKFTMLMSALIIGAVCLLLGMVVLILLSISLAQLFCMIMHPALAYLSAAGVIVLLVVLVIIFKRPLLLTPISKFITRLLFK